MKHTIITIIAFFVALTASMDLMAQDEMVAMMDAPRKGAFNEVIETTDAEEKSAYYFRRHKQLSPFFSGYAVEVARSQGPLRRNHTVFRQFGQVKVHRLDDGGYSYVITGFRNKKAVEKFVEDILSIWIPDAQIYRYKKGSRKVNK